MMKKKEIIACVKQNKNVSDYELTLVRKDSRELFYVRDHLEINRAVDVQNASLRIYVSSKDKIGSSLVTITAADDDKSLARKINQAVSKARQAQNSYYPLPKKTVLIRNDKPFKKDLNEVAARVAKAIFKADHYRNGWINSTEIFISHFDNEFINSQGIDHRSDTFRIEVECIPTWSNKKEEFELYKFYESGKIDLKQITAEIEEILQSAKDRSRALKISDVRLPEDLKVLVKGDMLEEIAFALAGDQLYSSIYTLQNHYQTGDTVSQTPFDLIMKGTIPGCSRSKKYDDNGVVLGMRKIIAKGKVKDSYGDIRFGHYLVKDDISGRLPVCEIKAEGKDPGKQPHLIIEMFSAPQLEPDSGYWGGEVRLARYFDGKKYIPLTGFSIAGSLYEDIKTVGFSKQQTVSPSYKGPRYMIFQGIKIS